MKNEEFQRIVLEELRDLKVGQGRLEVRMDRIEDKVGSLEDKVGSLEDRMGSLESKLDAVVEQTAILTEFKEDTSKKLGIIIEENKVFKEIIGRHEVDIEMLKKKIC
jgi:chromosome segregation ATPase